MMFHVEQNKKKEIKKQKITENPKDYEQRTIT